MPRRVPAARSASSSVAPRARAASVAATDDEKNGPGSGMRPICSATMHTSSRPAPSPAPPSSSGTSKPVHPSSTRVDHSSGVNPRSSSARLRSKSRVAYPLERGARHVLECQLPLVVREVHGLRPLPYPFIDVAPARGTAPAHPAVPGQPRRRIAPTVPVGRALRRAVVRGPLIPDTGVRVHGGRVPFPRWTSP